MATTAQSTALNPLGAIRLLRTAGAALCTQASLHGQLARVGWAEEKNRLLSMLVIGLLGFASLLCVLLIIAALVLALCWDTDYRIPVTIALVSVYGLGSGFAWHRLGILSARGGEAFAATREEFASDLALLKSKL